MPSDLAPLHPRPCKLTTWLLLPCKHTDPVGSAYCLTTCPAGEHEEQHTALPSGISSRSQLDVQQSEQAWGTSSPVPRGCFLCSLTGLLSPLCIKDIPPHLPHSRPPREPRIAINLPEYTGASGRLRVWQLTMIHKEKTQNKSPHSQEMNEHHSDAKLCDSLSRHADTAPVGPVTPGPGQLSGQCHPALPREQKGSPASALGLPRQDAQASKALCKALCVLLPAPTHLTTDPSVPCSG